MRKPLFLAVFLIYSPAHAMFDWSHCLFGWLNPKTNPRTLVTVPLDRVVAADLESGKQVTWSDILENLSRPIPMGNGSVPGMPRSKQIPTDGFSELTRIQHFIKHVLGVAQIEHRKGTKKYTAELLAHLPGSGGDYPEIEIPFRKAMANAKTIAEKSALLEEALAAYEKAAVAFSSNSDPACIVVTRPAKDGANAGAETVLDYKLNPHTGELAIVRRSDGALITYYRLHPEANQTHLNRMGATWIARDSIEYFFLMTGLKGLTKPPKRSALPQPPTDPNASAPPN